ncbi:GNAT family N-acetyltransferase [Chamaesiphon sp. GL140_3_metabinner_50]|uniref:GNAT family N-acetyltransferase n=1 Tax=Chamaesiphon sp. GL140_3_metabinner_50 TaxID=2970812 RepID=UPI0025E315E6|nr:GNAT family N-acetyltransferase [Chamaesiphon sp. GL140_3_metabinner_50]
MENLSITMRSYKGESDLHKIVDLFDACERVDRVELSISIDRLRLAFKNPAIDPVKDLRLWENANGQLIGFSQSWIEEPIGTDLADGGLWFIVHPTARGGDIEAKMIALAESRTREVAQERGGQPKLFTWSLSSQIERISLIKQHGFVESRRFFNLSRSLHNIIPPPQLFAGFTIRSVDRSQDAQAWVDMHNRAFFGQWNFHPLTVESYQHRLQDSDYLPEIDLVAVDYDGKFASACYCSIDPTHNTFTGRQEGWIVLLFTDPDFQRRGLAKAMLLNGLARLRDFKMDIVKIGVDSRNSFGAGKLYESVGFEQFRTNTAYVKHL